VYVFFNWFLQLNLNIRKQKQGHVGDMLNLFNFHFTNIYYYYYYCCTEDLFSLSKTIEKNIKTRKELFSNLFPLTHHLSFYYKMFLFNSDVLNRIYLLHNNQGK
jgi:hypothetical protein